MSSATPIPPGTETARTAVWTVLELLRWTTGHFERQGIESARLDAECLLAFALGVERLRLYIDFDKPVNEGERAAFRWRTCWGPASSGPSTSRSGPTC